MDFKGAAKDYNEVVDEKEDEEEESTQDFDVDEIAEIDKSDKSDSIRTESSKKNINDNSNERQVISFIFLTNIFNSGIF